MQVGQIAWSPPSNLTACSAALTTERAMIAPSAISTIARLDVSNSARNSEPINSLLSGGDRLAGYCQVEQNLPVLRKDSAGSETENQ